MSRFPVLVLGALLALAAPVFAQKEPPAGVCREGKECHPRKHPREKVACPLCGKRRVPANDAACRTCSRKQKLCRHCGRTLPPKGSRGWGRVPARVEVIGGKTFLSFQPLLTRVLQVDRAVRRVTVYGVEGRLAASVEGGTIILARQARVAEVALHDVVAPKVRLRVPGSALRRPRPPPQEALTPLGTFKPTFYWVLLEEKFDGERDTPLPGHDGKEIGRFPAEFVRKARIEGTAKLRDGRVVNVWGKGTWKVVDAPNGLGTKGFHLIPFRSIAVDRRVIPIGTPLFIREAVGMRLPDGTLHDGRFYAHDVGGGIKGKRIDLFTGMGRQQAVFATAGIRNMRPLTLYREEEGGEPKRSGR